MTLKDYARIIIILAVFVLCGLGAYMGEMSFVAAIATAIASLTTAGLLAPSKEKTVVVASEASNGTD